MLTTIFSFNTIGFLEFSGDGLPGVSFNPDVFYLRNNQFRVPTAALSLDYFLMGVSGLTLAFLLPILKPYAASVLVMLMALPSLYLGINMPLRDSAVPMQYSLLVLLMLYGTNVLISYLGETRRKQKLVNVFGLYVPPEIVRQMSRQSESLELGGESRNL
ncbi:MAG: hypothetical protein WD601_08005, partial [Pseudohongiellaceae bacterium]